MDKFREMKTFISVVECRSFVGAAERLRISKSVVSRIIQQLENRLGGRLLQRTTRSLSLTDAGQKYYQRCQQILNDLKEAENIVETSSSKVSGLLRICSSLTFGSMIWANNIDKFLHRYPDINLEINWTDRNVDLIGEGYDMAFVVSKRQEDSSLVSRKIASSKMLLCAAPSYLEKFGTPQTVEDLEQHHFIRFSCHDVLSVYSPPSSTAEWQLKGNTRLTVNTGHNCLVAAAAGIGIVYLPEFAVKSLLFSGVLHQILPDFSTEETGIYAVYPSRQYLSGKVRAMVDFLVECFQE